MRTGAQGLRGAGNRLLHATNLSKMGDDRTGNDLRDRRLKQHHVDRPRGMGGARPSVCVALTGHALSHPVSTLQVIPAENLVALLQALQCAPAEAPEGSTGKPSAAASEQPAAGRPGHAPGRAEGGACRLIAAVGSASDALLMLGALEAGTDGVLLRTGDDAEVRFMRPGGKKPARVE